MVEKKSQALAKVSQQGWISEGESTVISFMNKGKVKEQQSRRFLGWLDSVWVLPERSRIGIEQARRTHHASMRMMPRGYQQPLSRNRPYHLMEENARTFYCLLQRFPRSLSCSLSFCLQPGCMPSPVCEAAGLKSSHSQAFHSSRGTPAATMRLDSLRCEFAIQRHGPNSGCHALKPTRSEPQNLEAASQILETASEIPNRHGLDRQGLLLQQADRLGSQLHSHQLAVQNQDPMRHDSAS